MTDLFKAIELTRKLAEARNLAKRITGDKYEARIAPYRATLQRWQKESGKPMVEVCFQLCRMCSERDTEYGQMLAFAACVEEMEAGGAK